MSERSDGATESAQLREVESAFRELLDCVKALASREGSVGLFPGGIDHVALELKAGAIAIKAEISGPGANLDRSSDPFSADLLATKNVTIDFAANAEGVLKFAGKSFACLGSNLHKYPTDLTVNGIVGDDKFAVWHSAEFGVDMPFAVKIWGQRGIFIHEGADSIASNGGSQSAGCIHLAPGHAKEFYDWVDGKTRIVIAYPW